MSRKSVDREAEEDMSNHMNGDQNIKVEQQEDKNKGELKTEEEDLEEEVEEDEDQEDAKADHVKKDEVTEEQELSEEERVGGEEEDARNMEDDSINLMLEEEEKMLEDELALNYPERLDQEDSLAEGKDSARTKDASHRSPADSAGKKDSRDNESQDKKECDKPKSSSDDTGKDDKTKDDKDHKKSSSSSSSGGRNLWVSGLASSTRAQDLKCVFSKYGKVTSAKIVTNAKTPGAKCYGFVTMMSSEDAAKCIAQLNHTELHGRMIQVEKAKGEPGGPSRNKASSTRKPSDSKKDSGGDKKKEGDKKEGVGEKEGSGEDKGKEGAGKKEQARSRSKDTSTSKDRDRRLPNRTRGPPYDRPRPDHRVEGYRPGVHHPRPGRNEVLSFKQIMEERERQRMRARERLMREEDRRRKEEEVRQRNIERRQREEADRLQREREKLRIEREKIERQKHELLRLEREHQRLEREKLEREREELRRQQLRIYDSSPAGGAGGGRGRPARWMDGVKEPLNRREMGMPDTERIVQDGPLWAGKARGTRPAAPVPTPQQVGKRSPKKIAGSRYEESRRSLKRPADDRDRREFFEDRKRPAPENRSRFEEPAVPQRRYNEDKSYERSKPSRFDHPHGGHGSHGGGGDREELRGGPGGVSGGSNRYDDRWEVRGEREDRRPGDRSGPRDDRDHRAPPINSSSRDRGRDRYSGGGVGSSSGGGGDSWRTGSSGLGDSKGASYGSSSMMGGGPSTLTSRGGDSSWRTSSTSDSRWGSSGGGGVGGRGGMGDLAISNMIRGELGHGSQSSMTSVAMSMMSQSDRFSMSGFRKY